MKESSAIYDTLPEHYTLLGSPVITSFLFEREERNAWEQESPGKKLRRESTGCRRYKDKQLARAVEWQGIMARVAIRKRDKIVCDLPRTNGTKEASGRSRR